MAGELICVRCEMPISGDDYSDLGDGPLCYDCGDAPDDIPDDAITCACLCDCDAIVQFNGEKCGMCSEACFCGAWQD